MSDKLTVTVHHPISGKSWEMKDLDPGMTPNAVVNELIMDGHLPRQPEGYQMMVKGGATLNMDESLQANKVVHEANLVVAPHTKGGAAFQTDGVLSC